MANTDSPWGAKWIGGPKLMLRDDVSANYGTALYVQEILGKVAAGTVEIAWQSCISSFVNPVASLPKTIAAL